MNKPLSIALALAVAAAALHSLPAQAQARNELALEWMPGGLAKDGRRSRDLSYNREFGNGWALGGSVGYGNVHRAKSDDGLLLLLRVRWRVEGGLNGLPWLRPQLGLEYGGTTNVFQTADLAGLYAGAYLVASPELGFTVDYWSGKSHFESGSTNEKRSVGGVRLGLAVRF